MCDDGRCSRRSGRFHRGIPDLTGLSEVLLFRFEVAVLTLFPLLFAGFVCGGWIVCTLLRQVSEKKHPERFC